MLEISSIIFFTSLLACVPLGYVYKNIEDVQKRGMLGTGVGILIATGLCGLNVFYTVLLVAGNIIVIKTSDIRSVHKMSLMFTLMFLFYLFHYTVCTTYAAWLYQTIALRLVGLAFEINICDKMTSKTETKPASSSSKTPAPVVDDSVTRLSAADIATYAYFFLGIHRGPYYTWKTFNDHLNSTISKQGDFSVVTQQKLIKASLLAVGFIVLQSKYPISMYKQNEFYENYGTDYRFLIGMPQLLIYYLKSQIILMISTSACSAAGFGVYPVKAQAVPGAGPTKPVGAIEGSTDKEEYNFSMLKCFDNERILMGPKMKDTMRGWDMATRYWFSQYIVKNLISNNFEVRSACSFLVWTIWVGSGIEHIIIALTLWVYIHLESDYAQLYAESLTGPWNLGFAIMRMFCLFYLTPCIVLKDKNTILRYYNSIYWIYHIVLVVLFLAAIAVHKIRTRVRSTPDADGPPKLESSVPGNAKSKTEDETSSKPKTKEGTKDNEPSTSGNKGATCKLHSQRDDD